LLRRTLVLKNRESSITYFTHSRFTINK